MIQYGKSGKDFFHMVEPFRLKEIPPSPHDFPISSKSLKDLIMGFATDDDDGTYNDKMDVHR